MVGFKPKNTTYSEFSTFIGPKGSFLHFIIKLSQQLILPKESGISGTRKNE